MEGGEGQACGGQKCFNLTLGIDQSIKNVRSGLFLTFRKITSAQKMDFFDIVPGLLSLRKCLSPKSIIRAATLFDAAVVAKLQN